MRKVSTIRIIYELMSFLEEKEIDILLVGQAWLHNEKEFEISGYNVYRTDKQNQSGGSTAILVNLPTNNCILTA